MQIIAAYIATLQEIKEKTRILYRDMEYEFSNSLNYLDKFNSRADTIVDELYTDLSYLSTDKLVKLDSEKVDNAISAAEIAKKRNDSKHVTLDNVSYHMGLRILQKKGVSLIVRVKAKNLEQTFDLIEVLTIALESLVIGLN